MIGNQPSLLNTSSAELSKPTTQNCLASLTLVTWLGLAGVSWIASSAFAPQIAQANTTKVELSLERQNGENYENLARRAEAAASAAAQQSFNSNSSLSKVSITILGQNEGSIVPILSLEVDRQSWTKRPQPKDWVTYFPNAKSLLKLDVTAVKAPTPPKVEQVPSGRFFVY